MPRHSAVSFITSTGGYEQWRCKLAILRPKLKCWSKLQCYDTGRFWDFFTIKFFPLFSSFWTSNVSKTPTSRPPALGLCKMMSSISLIESYRGVILVKTSRLWEKAYKTRLPLFDEQPLDVLESILADYFKDKRVHDGTAFFSTLGLIMYSGWFV